MDVDIRSGFRAVAYLKDDVLESQLEALSYEQVVRLGRLIEKVRHRKAVLAVAKAQKSIGVWARCTYQPVAHLWKRTGWTHVLSYRAICDGQKQRSLQAVFLGLDVQRQTRCHECLRLEKAYEASEKQSAADVLESPQSPDE